MVVLYSDDFAIGGPAAAKVVRADVHPVKKPTGGAAREVLKELQSRLDSPPPWLAQIMGGNKGNDAQACAIHILRKTPT